MTFVDEGQLWNRNKNTRLQIREMVKVLNTDQTRSGVHLVDLVSPLVFNKPSQCFRYNAND